jgi:hypothetical protein
LLNPPRLCVIYESYLNVYILICTLFNWSVYNIGTFYNIGYTPKWTTSILLGVTVVARIFSERWAFERFVDLIINLYIYITFIFIVFVLIHEVFIALALSRFVVCRRVRCEYLFV